MFKQKKPAPVNNNPNAIDYRENVDDIGDQLETMASKHENHPTIADNDDDTVLDLAKSEEIIINPGL